MGTWHIQPRGPGVLGGQLGLENVHCRLAAPASTLPELSGVSASSSSFAHERNEGGWSLWVGGSGCIGVRSRTHVFLLRKTERQPRVTEVYSV